MRVKMSQNNNMAVLEAKMKNPLLVASLVVVVTGLLISLVVLPTVDPPGSIKKTKVDEVTSTEYNIKW